LDFKKKGTSPSMRIETIRKDFMGNKIFDQQWGFNHQEWGFVIQEMGHKRDMGCTWDGIGLNMMQWDGIGLMELDLYGFIDIKPPLHI
jgi:hypothetical protein